MSEGDVSLIRDEDVLRRMWQQTEDFSRKKEIRAHMYKLREERLKLLYSPEPTRKDMSRSLVSSFADEGFQRAKRQEVRGETTPSPPRDHRPAAELQALSNAGWSVQAENTTEDGGITRVRNVRADIEGGYDVEGGKGKFVATDNQRQALSEYQDDTTSFSRRENSAATSRADSTVQKTADGATVVTKQQQHQHSSVKHVSSSTRVIDDDNVSQNKHLSSSRTTNVVDSAKVTGELTARRVEYPDDNTKVIVETREMPDGSIVTTTKREFRDSHSRSAQQARSETRSCSSSQSHSRNTRDTRDIVNSQRVADERDFNTNHTKHLILDNSSQTTKSHDSKITRESNIDSRKTEDYKTSKKFEDYKSTQKVGDCKSTKDFKDDYPINERRTERHESTATDHSNTARVHEKNQRNIDETDHAHITRDIKSDSNITNKKVENVEKTTDEYQTTYQSDYTDKKIHSELSPSHQAWASTLRGDSPDKSRRGGSPNKTDRGSSYDRYSTSTYSVSSYTSPDRKSRKPSRSPDKRPESPTHARSTPDATAPGYMRPTHASQHHIDHYKFVDEETKTYSRSNQERQTKETSPDHPSGSDDRPSSPSILRKCYRSPSPPKGPVSFSQNETDEYQSTKQFSSNYDHSEQFTKKDTTVKKDVSREPSTTQKIPRESSPTKKISREPSPTKKIPIEPSPTKKIPREPSPTKYGSYEKKKEASREASPTKSDIKTPRKPSPTNYGTYDRKRHTEDVAKDTKQDSTEEKYSSLMRREKTVRNNVPPVKPADSVREPSPSKYSTYDRKQRTDRVESQTTSTQSTDKYDSQTRGPKADSPRKESRPSPSKITRESTSPMKSPTKHKTTSDFINTERTFEEINKKTRQLVTPSSSPTRKPKNVEPPSTGQSSPTTSVSGFVYYHSPSPSNETKNIVTDLDDEELFTSKETNTTSETTKHTYTRPDSLDLKRSPSPSRIPCKSPSPPKKTSPVKEILPRKSSLKKTSLTNIPSPVEKPPTTFKVSPTTETQPEHKVVKKDHADKPTDSDVKPKPTLERRETYTERCLKILGVIEDTSATSVAKKDLSPRSRSSPGIGGDKLTALNTDRKRTKEQVTDFISKEQEDTRIKTKSKTPSRDNSPTKLQDIISVKTVSSHDNTTENSIKITKTDKETGYHQTDGSIKLVNKPTRSSQSPEKKPKQSPVRPSPSPDRKPGHQQPVERKPQQPESKPTRSSISPDRKPGYMKTTVASATRFDATSEDVCQITSKTVQEITDRETGYQTDRKTTLLRSSISPSRESPLPQTDRASSTRSSVSPDREHHYMQPTISSKFHEATTEIDSETTEVEDLRNDHEVSHDYMNSTISSSHESTTKSPIYTESVEIEDKMTTSDSSHDYMKSTISSKLHEVNSSMDTTKVEDMTTLSYSSPKHSRTPSPAKTKLTHDVTEFIQSEREKEILDRVQTSLSKLSPSREQRSPSRDKSPNKSTLSLQDIDVIATETVDKKDKKVETKTQIDTKTHAAREIVKPKDEKPKQKPASSPTSRTVSPTKKPTGPTPSRVPESTYKARSTSPRKAVESPQSPLVPKQSGIKPREPTPSYLRKPSPSKVEKTVIDNKSTVTKQISCSKTSSFKSVASKFMNKTESETKRVPAPKENKENVSPRKEDAKVTRTASDHTIKAKKPSPQRMKSKPEIQVIDVTPSRPGKSAPSRIAVKEPQGRLAPKPKSATALNTPTDDDDVIIDVEQAKSSRENSPERRAMCPTPVGISEDIGTPRLPDEVKEPEDEFVWRSHHTIHENESLVDDIIEISEDEEVTTNVTQSDECLLSVTDKVNKFTTKIESVAKPKDSNTAFKDTERRVHSDFIDETLKSDECLLSVSEKVNKFAKGPQDVRGKSPARKITDEYDTETVYQDDYTKLSVNDKAHLFVETAENSKVTKTKPAQKVARPDLSNVEETLRSDDCMLSVSDKVNKFVKTAEQFLNEFTHEPRDTDKEKLVKERYENFIKQLQEDEGVEIDIVDTETPEVPSFAKETVASHTKVKDYVSPHVKQPVDKTPIGKITALRSSEAVKKAKALFENIATTQKDTSTKLLDIGVMKKSPKTDSTIALHPSDEDSPNVTDSEVDGKVPRVNGTQRLNGHSDRRSPVRQSPTRRVNDITTTKSVLSRYPAAWNETPEKKAPKQTDTKAAEIVKAQEKMSTSTQKTITNKEEMVEKSEEIGVSTRRGSGKFGVELRRTSAELTGVERRRSKEERRPSLQPCIEDMFDVQLLEQMLEKVSGYEQRRRIRSQIRVAKKRLEEQIESSTYTRSKTTTKSPERRTYKSPERRPYKSPERKANKTLSPERVKSQPRPAAEPTKLLNGQAKDFKETAKAVNGHAKEPGLEKKPRPQSPEKKVSKPHSPTRQSSPDKRIRPSSPSKITKKPKTNRFSEYASAYMKKIGIDDNKITDKTKKVVQDQHTEVKTSHEERTVETKSSTMSKMSSFTERKSSKETITSVNGEQMNGKRSPSPKQQRSSPNDRLYQRSPSPDFKRRQTRTEVYETQPKVVQKHTVIKTVYGTDKDGGKRETTTTVVYESDKNEEKPAWITSRNLKKVSSESHSTTRSGSPWRTDGPAVGSGTPRTDGVEAITSGYGPGPTDSSGRPLFGIRALRNSARESSTSSRQCAVASSEVTVAPSPEQLSQALQQKTTRTRMHGLAAITARHAHSRDTNAPPSTVAVAKRAPQRQNSVKTLQDKIISTSGGSGSERRDSYPKAGLILRSGGLAHDKHTTGSVEVTTTSSSSVSPARVVKMEHTVTHRVPGGERSFLDSSSKVTGVQDILTRMKNADIVIEAGDTTEDSEARALLNKFLGATVLMAGMQNYVTGAAQPTNTTQRVTRTQESVSVGSGGSGGKQLTQAQLDNCWDEQLLRDQLSSCTEYEQRRRVRTRLRALMAEQEACTGAVVAALGADGDKEETTESDETEVTVSARRGSAEKTTTTTTTKTSKVVETMTRPAPQKVSPFAKFRQLEKQTSTNSQNSAPASPGSPGAPLFKFTDPALHASALTIKERLLQWCRDKTRDYENVKLENFSTSWADGLAFCALMHHFLPDAFDYSALEPTKRRHNFTLAFKVADEKAGIYPLLDVDDMVAMRKPDWKCVFTYVQAIHRRFKDQP